MVQCNHVIIIIIIIIIIIPYHFQLTKLYKFLNNSTPRRWLQILLLAVQLSVWVLTRSTILFQAFLTVAILLQPQNFILPKSALTSSSNLTFLLQLVSTLLSFSPSLPYPFLQYAQSIYISYI